MKQLLRSSTATPSVLAEVIATLYYTLVLVAALALMLFAGSHVASFIYAGF